LQGFKIKAARGLTQGFGQAVSAVLEDGLQLFGGKRRKRQAKAQFRQAFFGWQGGQA